MEEMIVTPNWAQTARFFITQFISHGFDQGKSIPMFSFIEQIRYLEKTDPAELDKILNELQHGRYDAVNT